MEEIPSQCFVCSVFQYFWFCVARSKFSHVFQIYRKHNPSEPIIMPFPSVPPIPAPGNVLSLMPVLYLSYVIILFYDGNACV